MSFDKYIWDTCVTFYPEKFNGLSIKKFWDSVNIFDSAGLYTFNLNYDEFSIMSGSYFDKRVLVHAPCLRIREPSSLKSYSIEFDDDGECIVCYGSKYYDILNIFYSDIMHVIYSYLKGDIHV